MVMRRAFKTILPTLFVVPSLYAEQATTFSPTTLTLEEAVERALQYNEGILLARYGVREAEAGVTVARAEFLPRISLQASYARLAELPAFEMAMPEYGSLQLPVFGLTGDTIGFTVVPGVVGADTLEFQMGEEENYLGRASLQQPLFTWGKILTGYQISSLNLKAVREDYRKTESQLVLGVTKSFYAALSLEQLVRLMEDAKEQAARHVEAVEKRYEAGLASRFDLLRARVQLANMEPQVAQVRNGLELALTGLKALLGFPQDMPLTLSGELKYEPIEVDLAQSLVKARANRPEVTALMLRKSIASKALSIARKANWPNVALLANYDYKKPLYFENEWGTDWSVGIGLEMPLFTGFGNLGRMEEARARLGQAEHGLKLLEQSIELEVRSACLQLDQAKRLAESQKENVAQAEEALRIAEDRYEIGLATSLEVMDTQLAVTRAKTNYLQSLSEHLIAKAELRRATGEQLRLKED